MTEPTQDDVDELELRGRVTVLEAIAEDIREAIRFVIGALAALAFVLILQIWRTKP